MDLATKIKKGLGCMQPPNSQQLFTQKTLRKDQQVTFMTLIEVTTGVLGFQSKSDMKHSYQGPSKLPSLHAVSVPT